MLPRWLGTGLITVLSQRTTVWKWRRTGGNYPRQAPSLSKRTFTYWKLRYVADLFHSGAVSYCIRLTPNNDMWQKHLRFLSWICFFFQSFVCKWLILSCLCHWLQQCCLLNINFWFRRVLDKKLCRVLEPKNAGLAQPQKVPESVFWLTKIFLCLLAYLLTYFLARLVELFEP